MNFKAFLDFVEIKTKIASVIPFIMGILYTIYKYGEINIFISFLMFFSMLFFDMTVTAINNYFDYKNEKKYEFEYKNNKNPLVVYMIKEKTAELLIFLMLSISTFLGVLLVFNTNILVLLLGMICFFVGIFYTFGPIPISRIPLGEIFSGIFMGFFIPFTTIYINTLNINGLNIGMKSGNITFTINIIYIVSIIIISIPFITCIANIMLANNICDLDDDVKVQRFTLVYYIGKNFSINLYRYLYYIAYMGVLIGIIFKVLPIACLITFFTLKPVLNNIKLFKQKQIKSKTFILAIKNFVLISGTIIVSLFISIIMN